MEPEISRPVITKNLSFKYGEKTILSDISLSIEKGRLYSIIGPNGSGKTTLLKNISKILEPMAKTIYIENDDITQLSGRDIARRISVVPQNTQIDFDFTVLDIVLMGRSPYMKRFQTENAEDIKIAENAMKLTNVWHLKDRNINEISGGERQRAIVARALAQQAGIMLLDEPVSQLDIHYQIELMETIRYLIKTSDLTVITVMHDLNLAAQYSDYLILLYKGDIVCQGTPKQVITKENIEEVYNLEAYIVNNPITGKPYVMHAKRLTCEKATGEL